MSIDVAVGIIAAAFILGVILGMLVARRGRRIRFEWKLLLEAEEGEPTPPPDESR